MTTTILDALRAAQLRLQGVSPTPRLDADLLLGHVLRCSRAQLIVRHHDSLSEANARHYDECVSRRINLEPVAYITNQREFYGLDFYVDQRVLVPRPESELLIELAIAAARTLQPSVALDIGTGSGCLAISMAVQAVAPQIIATDISRDALAVAQYNCTQHGADQVHVVATDLCHGIQPVPLIISNPPYTILDDIDEGVRRHEPHLALIGGDDDGAAIYRRLIALLPYHLCRPGFFACEIDARQGAIVATLLRQTFPAGHVTVVQDLAGLDRVVTLWLTA
jgi:release factor glutamine methyltransferase